MVNHQLKIKKSILAAHVEELISNIGSILFQYSDKTICSCSKNKV